MKRLYVPTPNYLRLVMAKGLTFTHNYVKYRTLGTHSKYGLLAYQISQPKTVVSVHALPLPVHKASS